jgi:WD40 repeat protein
VEKGAVIRTIAVGNSTDDMQVAVAWAKSGGIGPISVSLNGHLNVLDLSSGKISKQIRAHTGEPTTLSCDYTSDKKEVYVGDSSGGVTRYMDYSGDNVVGHSHQSVSKVATRKGKVYSTGFDDTIKEISGLQFSASAGIGGQVQSLSVTEAKPDWCGFVTEKKAGIVSNGQIIGSIDLPFYGQGVALNPAGTILVVGEKDSKNPQARVYSVSPDGTKITPTDKACKELLASPISMAFSEDGKYFAIGDNLKEVSLWKAATFEPVTRQMWVFHTSTITALSWSPDSKFIATGSTDSMIYVWNVESKTKKLKIPFAHKTGVTGVDWVGPTTLVSCGADRCVRFWEIQLPV